MMRRATEGKVRKLVDGQGRYLWPLQSGSMFGAPNGVGQRTLLEYPIANSDFMPADGTDTNQVLLFGDFSAYIIIETTNKTTYQRQRPKPFYPWRSIPWGIGPQRMRSLGGTCLLRRLRPWLHAI